MAPSAVARAPRKLGRRPVLDGMRGIAVLLVIMMHTGLLANGYIGVDVFFGLSGFLITTLLMEEWDGTGSISFRRFYERRARRLLPALFLLVAAFALVYVIFNPFSGWSLGHRVATTLLFVNNWVAGLGHQNDLGVLNPTWSLAQEEQFYLLWPLVLWVLLRLRVRPLALVGFLVVTIVALVQAVPHVQHALPAYSVYYSPLDRGAELFLGCAAAVLWRHQLVPRALEWPLTGLLLLGGLVFILFDVDLPTRWTYLGAALVAVPLMLSLLGARDSLLARVIGCRPLRYIGTISYGLYLCNLLINNLLMHYVPGRSTYFYTPIVLVASILVAGASWKFVESRVLGRRRRVRPPRELIGIRAPQPEHV
jgi:peptidoglycan/LPS O-acetylase OafA/YrhL